MSFNALVNATMYLLAGLLFGLGLAFSGMTDPQVVLGFLDISGDWNPALMLVMCSALIITSIGYAIILKKDKPVSAGQFSLPTKTRIDRPLVIGAMIFGAGWGLYGYCPGPALASLAGLDIHSFVFVAAMLTGMLVANQLNNP